MLGSDAEAAEEELTELLDGLRENPDPATLVSAWDTDGVTNGCEATDHNITGDTAGERLDEIAAEITHALAQVSESDVVIVDGLVEYLKAVRDDVAKEETEDADEH
ncbi:hypothetical protein ACIRQF_00065 [Streptomyces sp. NPDC101191]|uniref:hypothetical protein n=1 Tax=Streptomyces sp. NPDC101191 TaxID=3366126 RepID=UPI00381410A4